MWISVSGQIGSGKTTLSRALSARYGATYVGIGDFVRSRAREQGVPLERRHLQELGRRLIETAGGEAAFVREVVSRAGGIGTETVVVDGVRALAMRREVGVLAGTNGALHVHIAVPEKTRRKRLSARGAQDDEIAAADADASERGFSDLSRTADVVVPGDDLEEAIRLVAAGINRRRA